MLAMLKAGAQVVAGDRVRKSAYDEDKTGGNRRCKLFSATNDAQVNVHLQRHVRGQGQAQRTTRRRNRRCILRGQEEQSQNNNGRHDSEMPLFRCEYAKGENVK